LPVKLRATQRFFTSRRALSSTTGEGNSNSLIEIGGAHVASASRKREVIQEMAIVRCRNVAVTLQ
jgi:hypothetical protein